MNTPNKPDSIYKSFTYESWQPGDGWSALVDDERYLVPLAREAVWNSHQERILSELQGWIASGWEPVDDVGPSAIRLSKSQELSPKVSLIDVFFWIVTLGVGLLIHLLLSTPRSYVVYRPVEFSVRMRRQSPQMARGVSAAAIA